MGLGHLGTFFYFSQKLHVPFSFTINLFFFCAKPLPRLTFQLFFCAKLLPRLTSVNIFWNQSNLCGRGKSSARTLKSHLRLALCKQFSSDTHVHIVCSSSFWQVVAFSRSSMRQNSSLYRQSKVLSFWFRNASNDVFQSTKEVRE